MGQRMTKRCAKIRNAVSGCALAQSFACALKLFRERSGQRITKKLHASPAEHDDTFSIYQFIPDRATQNILDLSFHLVCIQMIHNMFFGSRAAAARVCGRCPARSTHKHPTVVLQFFGYAWVAAKATLFFMCWPKALCVFWFAAGHRASNTT